MKKRAGAMFCCLLLLFPAAGALASGTDGIRARIESWRNAWQSRDLKRYAAHYHPAFHAGGMDLWNWMRQKMKRIRHAGPISVEIFGISVFMEKHHATARFIQRYSSSQGSDVGEKELVFEKNSGQWQIIAEQWSPLPGGIHLPAKAPDTRQDIAPERAPPDTGSAERTPGLEIRKGIGYAMDKSGVERVCIELDRFFIPEAFHLGGKNPRFVIDVRGISKWKADPAIPVNGKRIRRIRSYLHRNENRLRVVLDLEPAENYLIHQIYYDARHIYCVELTP